MYVRANKWDQAFSVIQRYLPEREYPMLYVNEARKFEAEGDFKNAERMYIQAKEPDLAINIYRKAKQYDHMIRLVTKYRKDLLKDTHSHLAGQLEREGNLKQAEHHYIEAGAWMIAVEMYRAHDMWEDCLRVAKTNGDPTELAEIGIKIAESMEGEKGTQFLIKNGLIDAAVEFEATQHRFDEAFRLANNHAKYKLPEVHLKYALHLEDEHRYQEAEDEFIKANKPMEAISMYEHKEDWHSALSVARQFAPESVTKVFQNQAKFYLEKRRDYAKAEQAFLNAKEPDKAINMYQEARMYGEALRVANKHAPHLVHQINENYSRGPQASNQSPDEILNSAKVWEDSRDYQKAINRYLEITENMFSPEALEEIWSGAFNLAMTYCKDRVQDVAMTLGPRLIKINKFDSAAEIYENCGFFDKAIESYLQCQKWDRAFECAQQLRPAEMQQMWMSKIQEQKKASLIQGGKFNKLVEGGDMSGLEMLSQRGQWEECLSLAEKQGPDVLNTYLMKFSKAHLAQAQWKETARVLVRYGCPAIQQILPVYKTIAVEVLATDNVVEMGVLKEMLSKLVEGLEAQVPRTNPIYIEFFRFLVITHLQLMKVDCQKHNLTGVLAKLTSCLLRYTKEIRPDKAYYDAGEANRKAGLNDAAFIFLNRYIDLYDAIDDIDNAPGFDNAEFEQTDIPVPEELPLPDTNFLSGDQRDAVRDWVLQISAGADVGRSLPSRRCEHCGAGVYECSLQCYSCRNEWEPCIITGLPLVKSDTVHCKICARGAIREHWNDYIAATMHCPWCKSMQTQY